MRRCLVSNFGRTLQCQPFVEVRGTLVTFKVSDTRNSSGRRSLGLLIEADEGTTVYNQSVICDNRSCLFADVSQYKA